MQCGMFLLGCEKLWRDVKAPYNADVYNMNKVSVKLISFERGPDWPSRRGLINCNKTN